MTKSPARIKALDGARGFFLLWVFAGHIDVALFPGGTIIIDMFFVLSGYVITALLLREHAATGRISISRFYTRRMLRLYPALVVVVAITFVFSEIQHIGNPPEDSLAAVLYLTDIWAQHTHYLSALLHTWSVSVEEQFYLLWPLTLVLALKRRWSLVAVLVGAAVICFCITGEFGRTDWPPLAVPPWLPTAQWPNFMAGALLALVTMRDAWASLARRVVTWPVALISAVVAIGQSLHPLYRWWMYGGLVVVPAVGFLAHLVLVPDSWLTRAFTLRPFVWLGERSYGFYLIHVPVIVLIGYGIHSLILRAAVTFPIAMALTLVSWHFVEMPFLRVKARFAAPGATLADTPPAAPSAERGGEHLALTG